MFSANIDEPKANEKQVTAWKIYYHTPSVVYTNHQVSVTFNENAIYFYIDVNF